LGGLAIRTRLRLRRCWSRSNTSAFDPARRASASTHTCSASVPGRMTRQPECGWSTGLRVSRCGSPCPTRRRVLLARTPGVRRPNQPVGGWPRPRLVPGTWRCSGRCGLRRPGRVAGRGGDLSARVAHDVGPSWRAPSTHRSTPPSGGESAPRPGVDRAQRTLRNPAADSCRRSGPSPVATRRWHQVFRGTGTSNPATT